MKFKINLIPDVCRYPSVQINNKERQEFKHWSLNEINVAFGTFLGFIYLLI